MENLYLTTDYWHDAGVNILSAEGNNISLEICTSENIAPDGSDIPSKTFELLLSGCEIVSGENDIEYVKGAIARGDSVEILSAEGNLSNSGVIKLVLNIFSFIERESYYVEFTVKYDFVRLVFAG